MKAPTIFILSGPSGAGKTTLLTRLFREKNIREKFIKGISFTTRKIRPQEKDGKDYFFVSQKKFLKLKKEEFFLEEQKVLENYYGTPKYFYGRAVKENKDLILCIDVKGGMYLKKKHKVGTIVTIFVSAPTKKELFKRLKKRVEKKEFITRRLQLARKELEFRQHYDYVITNHDIKDSVRKLRGIFLTAKKAEEEKVKL